MLGMEEGSGTRSSLLWEVKRLLDECEELPQILMMENVPQVHSKSNMPHFQKWLDYLTSKGYTSFWQDLNAKDYGVAQSRNRTFVISILGDYTYSFPDKMPLTKRMKDYLETNVPEKYYLKTDKAKELIDKLIKGGKILTDRQTDRQELICHTAKQKQLKFAAALKQDMMPELTDQNMKEAVLLSGQGCIFEKFTDIATCIMARDYKGFGNQLGNGVIECKKLD